MFKKFLLLTLALVFANASVVIAGPEDLIPRPVQYRTTSGTARADAPVREIIGARKFKAAVKDLPDFAQKEAYRLTVASGKVTIEALTEAGAFRGRQSLEFLKAMSADGTIACCEIFDYPRFRHRGLMFDISRHFRDKDFILKQIDLMALLKMNSLHLHLTDDAGWRIKIDAYPRLTSYAAWRPQALWRDWYAAGADDYVEEGTPGAYGGYLSKDELREIVAYAAARHIEVIPEIELPGHSLEVLKAYPELACTDAAGNPVFSSDLCPGNDLVIKVYKEILEEVMEIFPSEFIHIGGDEAEKHSWAGCPRCKARMQEHGLAGVDELQSWLIRQFDSFLESKGRRLLGWDEIMQGGLASGATVMSWRGTEQGIEAASAGHDVIMSPGNWCYINRTQDNPLSGEELVGGYLPLSRVYAYNPEDGFQSTDHLLGIQGNLWTEHVPTEDNFEYKAYPRAFALAEIGWTPQDQRNFGEFRPRAVRFADYITSIGYHPFNLHTELGERPEYSRIQNHLARGCKVTYNLPFSDKYPAEGTETLVNGLQGGWTYVGGRWQGFLGNVDVTIDLGEARNLSFVGAHFLANIDAWIAFPKSIEIWVSDSVLNISRMIPSSYR